MTGSQIIDDAALDRLLAGNRPPPMADGLADRIVAEAEQADRVPAMVPARSRPARRRPWARPRFIAGFVAFNLIAVSAIAAAVTGGVISVPKLAAISSQIFHRHHAAAPAPHRDKARAERHVPQRVHAAEPPPVEAGFGPPPPDLRPRWARRPDAMAMRGMMRERRRERALVLQRTERFDRFPALERRHAQPWRRRPQAGALAPWQQARGAWRKDWTPRRAERRLERQRPFRRWGPRPGGRRPRFR